jgi:hypothetical protein
MSEAANQAKSAEKPANAGATVDRRFSVAPMMDRVDCGKIANRNSYLGSRLVLL